MFDVHYFEGIHPLLKSRHVLLDPYDAFPVGRYGCVGYCITSGASGIAS